MRGTIFIRGGSHFVYNARLKIIKKYSSFIQKKLLLEEFNEEIFNALVEKIEILTPTHFVFELKSGLRVDEIVNCGSERGIRISGV